MSRLGASVRHSIDPSGGVVALTFDDGPDAQFTPQVLDVLAEHGVCATFFVLGARAVAERALMARLVAEGHAVGSHSWSHPYAARKTAVQLFVDYRRGRRAVEAVLNRSVSLFRAPHGYVDRRVATAIRLLKLEAWGWTRDPQDWREDATSDGIAASFRDVEPGDVLLLHDGRSTEVPDGDRSATVAALPEIIASVRASGLSFVTLPA